MTAITKTCEKELNRFLWKRNPRYDLTLLGEVESKNPYAFKKQKAVWIEIANVLKNCALKMKVTDRSCRERVKELLKNHRKNELAIVHASGISGEEASELEILLTNIGKLEEAKPNKQVKELYSRKDRVEAEAIRLSAVKMVMAASTAVTILVEEGEKAAEKPAVIVVEDIDGENDVVNPVKEVESTAVASEAEQGEKAVVEEPAVIVVEDINPSIAVTSKTGISTAVTSKAGTSTAVTSKTVKKRTNDELEVQYFQYDDVSDGDGRKRQLEEDEDFEFGPKKGRFENGRPNPKNELLAYLEEKNKKENALRKEELNLRERELENKTRELNIMQMKADAEIEERKKLNELLVKLVTRE